MFQLYDQDGEYYPFANTDARGLYAPGKEAALLRSSKAAVATIPGARRHDRRRPRRRGGGGVRLPRLRTRGGCAGVLRAAGAQREAARRRRRSRCATLTRTRNSRSARVGRRRGRESESESEPLDKIEKIVFCAEAIEVPDAELEEARHGGRARVAAAEAKRKAKVAKGKPVWLYCVKWEGVLVQPAVLGDGGGCQGGVQGGVQAPVVPAEARQGPRRHHHAVPERLPARGPRHRRRGRLCPRRGGARGEHAGLREEGEPGEGEDARLPGFRLGRRRPGRRRRVSAVPRQVARLGVRRGHLGSRRVPRVRDGREPRRAFRAAGRPEREEENVRGRD